MAETKYLRPSADISFSHTPSSGSTGYNLINEVTADGDSTTINGSDQSGTTPKTTTSKFKLTGTISQNHNVVSAKVVCVAKMSRTSDAKQSSLIISVGSSSSSQEITSTDYASYTYQLNASDVIRTGTSVAADLTLTTTLRNDKTTVYCYITQVYIEITTEHMPFSNFHVKMGGTWINATTAYQKINGVWTIISGQPSGWSTDSLIKWNPWLLNTSLSKSEPDVSQSGYLTTTHIPIQANTNITIQGAVGSSGVMFNTYNPDGTYYDWWSSGSNVIATVDGVSIYSRTLEASKVEACTFVKVNINQPAFNYCKVWTGDTLVFDGSHYDL